MPRLYIISGCNGAGKTTASYSLLPEMLECMACVEDRFGRDDVLEAHHLDGNRLPDLHHQYHLFVSAMQPSLE